MNAIVIAIELPLSDAMQNSAQHWPLVHLASGPLNHVRAGQHKQPIGTAIRVCVCVCIDIDYFKLLPLGPYTAAPLFN